MCKKGKSFWGEEMFSHVYVYILEEWYSAFDLGQYLDCHGVCVGVWVCMCVKHGKNTGSPP